VRNARFEECVAGRDESVARVKRHRLHLRVDDHRGIAARRGARNQRSHQRASDPAAAPLREDRHAADVAVGEQPRATDRRARSVLRERVNRREVRGVELERLRHTLLDDENCPAHVAQCAGRVGPPA
jgi:hypothetical protein